MQILFDGRDFILEEVDKQADILINGKKKRRARLVHGDRAHPRRRRARLHHVRRAAAGRRGRDDDRATTDAPARAISETQLHVTNQQLAGVRKLYEFSEKLMTMKTSTSCSRPCSTP